MTPALEQIKALPAKPSPTYAPVYAAALYPQLAEMARKHGYALAVHGSLQRDFDLIAIPWVENPSEPQAFVDAITSGFAAKEVGGPPSEKPHGRRAWSLSIGFGTCAIDLSFMPALQALRDEAGEAVWMFKDDDGKWRNFRNDRHRENIIADGRWEVRAFYPCPAPAAEAAPQGGREVCGAPRDGRTCYPDCDCETEALCDYGTVAATPPSAPAVDGER